MRSGLKCILCVGETLEQREKGLLQEVLQRQIRTAFEHSGLRNRFEIVGSNPVSPLLAIAYEPVWAIGTGKVAEPQVANEAHKICADFLARKWGAAFSKKACLLYGGSVTVESVKIILEEPYIHGVLVGGASLDVKKFIDLLREA